MDVKINKTVYLFFFLSLLYSVNSFSLFKNVKNYKGKADDILKKMTTEEKIGALFIVNHPKDLSLPKNTNPSGFLLDSKVLNKSRDELEQSFHELQEGKDPKLALAVEEEGGKYVSVSSIHRDKPFKAPMDLLFEGGKTALIEEEEAKIQFLRELHININIASIADACTKKDSFIYERTLGLNADVTTEFIQESIGEYVEHKFTACIKHFPGYGDNNETTTEADTRDDKVLEDYLKPFKAAIAKGIPMMLVSNLIVNIVDKENPVSTSKEWNKRIFSDMKYNGLLLAKVPLNKTIYTPIITNGYELMLTDNFTSSVEMVTELLNDKAINQTDIDRTVLRILQWRIDYVSFEEEEEEEANYTVIVVVSGVLSFILFGVIAFLLYKFVLVKKGEDEEEHDEHEHDEHEEHKEHKEKQEIEVGAPSDEHKEEDTMSTLEYVVVVVGVWAILYVAYAIIVSIFFDD